MTRAPKKRRERIHLERLQALRPELLAGDLEESEKPDFLVRSACGKITGVEVTELFHPSRPGESPLQAQEALRARIVSLAWRKYDQLNEPPVQVGLIFSDTYPLSKRKVGQIADMVVAVVRLHRPPLGEGAEIEYDRATHSYFPRELAVILVHCIEGVDESYWSAPGAVYVPPIGAKELREVVQAKSRLADVYRERCQDLWLLIVSDGWQLSSCTGQLRRR